MFNNSYCKKLGMAGLALSVSASSAWAATLYEDQTLVTSNPVFLGNFGTLNAVDGDTLAIGAYGEENSSNIDTGAVYVFEPDSSGDWSETQRLLTSDGAAGDLFGYGLALEGDTLVVGATGDDDGGANSGSLYIFERDSSGNWSEVDKLTASDGAAGDLFGLLAALDGDTLIVSAAYDDNSNGTNAGSLYVFERDSSGNWSEVEKLLASDGAADDRFGRSATLDGRWAIAGTYTQDGTSGAAYAFKRKNNGDWVEKDILTPSDGGAYDRFGCSVAMAGKTVIIGAHAKDVDSKNDQGQAYVFTRSGSDWTEQDKLLASDGVAYDNLGSWVSFDGDTAVTAAIGVTVGTNPAAGAVYTFDF